MDTLETLARRMATAADVRDLVRTMKAIAAGSIRHYERAATSLTAYDHTVDLGLRALLREQPLPPRRRRAASGPTGVIVLGTDQGLCGSFNEQVVQRLASDLDTGVLDRAGLQLVAVGGRVANRLREVGLVPERELGVATSAALLPELTQDLLLFVDAWRQQAVHQVDVIANRPGPTTPSVPHRQRLLPVPVERLQAMRAEPWPSRSLPRRTLDRELLLRELGRHALFVTLARALAWSAASEHAARLVAMQAAERNIDDRLDELRRDYHARRQTAITTEMLDIVAGADAVAAD